MFPFPHHLVPLYLLLCHLFCCDFWQWSFSHTHTSPGPSCPIPIPLWRLFTVKIQEAEKKSLNTISIRLVQQKWTDIQVPFLLCSKSAEYDKARSAKSVHWLCYRLDHMGFKSCRGKRVIDFPKHSDRIWDQLDSYSRVLGALSLEQCGWCIGIISHHHSLPRLRRSGAIQPLPSHAFTACTGTNLPSFSLHILFSIFTYTN